MRTALPAVLAAASPRPALLSSARRGLASVSPLFATTLLTAAVFLLPAPGARHGAPASAAGFKVPTLSSALEQAVF